MSTARHHNPVPSEPEPRKSISGTLLGLVIFGIVQLVVLFTWPRILNDNNSGFLPLALCLILWALSTAILVHFCEYCGMYRIVMVLLLATITGISCFWASSRAENNTLMVLFGLLTALSAVILVTNPLSGCKAVRRQIERR